MDPTRRAIRSGALALALWASAHAMAHAQAASFSLPQVLGFTHPVSLVRSPQGQRIGWVMVLRGERSLWVADGPEFQPRRLVAYGDDGQELTNLAFSGDGSHLVYVRGGNHAANAPAAFNLMPNPTSSPVQPRMQVWSVAVSGGAPVLLGDGDEPAPSPTGQRVVFRRDRELWVAPVDGSQPATRLFFARGTSQSPAWSPDGRTLAFVSNRGDYAYIALYTSDDQAIRYLAPSTSQDS
ncbi:MAG: TolB family protein, partial [Vicinamibacterales bacterium]